MYFQDQFLGAQRLNQIVYPKIESALLGYMRAECAEVMQAIEADGDWNDEREAAFKSAIDTFKSTQTW